MGRGTLEHYGWLKPLALRSQALHAFLCTYASHSEPGQEAGTIEEQRIVMAMPLRVFLQVAGCSRASESLEQHLDKADQRLCDLPKPLVAHLLFRLQYKARLQAALSALCALGLLRREMKPGAGGSNVIARTVLVNAMAVPWAEEEVPVVDEEARRSFWEKLRGLCGKGGAKAAMTPSDKAVTANKDVGGMAERKFFASVPKEMLSRGSWTVSVTQLQRAAMEERGEKESSHDTYGALVRKADELQVHPVALQEWRSQRERGERKVTGEKKRRPLHALERRSQRLQWTRSMDLKLLEVYIKGRIHFGLLPGERLWRWLAARMKAVTGQRLRSSLCKKRVLTLVERCGLSHAIDRLAARYAFRENDMKDDICSAESLEPLFLPVPAARISGEEAAVGRSLLAVALTPAASFDPAAAADVLRGHDIELINAKLADMCHLGLFALQQPSSADQRRIRATAKLTRQAQLPTPPFLVEGQNVVAAVQSPQSYRQTLAGGHVAALLHLLVEGSILLRPVGDLNDLATSIDPSGLLLGEQRVRPSLPSLAALECPHHGVCECTVWPWTSVDGSRNQSVYEAACNDVLRIVVNLPGILLVDLCGKVPWLDCCSVTAVVRSSSLFSVDYLPQRSVSLFGDSDSTTTVPHCFCLPLSHLFLVQQ